MGIASRIAKKIAKNASMNERISKIYNLSEKEYRAEVTKLVSLANKRISRLEQSELKGSPAYVKMLESGEARFSVKGKTHNELQREFSRLRKFITAETSTIKGINTVLRDMAKNTGIKHSSIKDLRQKADKFFELSSKVEQYLRSVEDMASAIGYQKIWEVINQYTESEKLDLSGAETDIEQLSELIGKQIASDHNQEDDDRDGWMF